MRWPAAVGRLLVGWVALVEAGQRRWPKVRHFTNEPLEGGAHKKNCSEARGWLNADKAGGSALHEKVVVLVHYHFYEDVATPAWQVNAFLREGPSSKDRPHGAWQARDGCHHGG
jgi:hypothetical protein